MVQTSFIALYRGQTVAEARVVAVTAEPSIVHRFISELAGEAEEVGDADGSTVHMPLQLVPANAE